MQHSVGTWQKAEQFWNSASKLANDRGRLPFLERAITTDAEETGRWVEPAMDFFLQTSI
jgi:hypothetical protein